MNEQVARRQPGNFDNARAPWLRLLGHRGLAPLILVVLSLALFAPGLMQVPPLDRDEPRFAQASKQMVESRDFIDIRFQDEARHKKPIGIYWLQAAAVEASGLGADAPIWVYRLPSLLGAMLSVLLTYWIARAFTGPRAAFVAGLLVASALLLGVEARLAKTDAVLLATILAGQGALARIWLDRAARRHPLMAALFWVSLALAVLVKGPVAPMVLGLTIAALCLVKREAGWLKALYPARGLVAFVLIVAPWFVAIYLQTEGAFFAEAVGKDLLGKVATGQESHGAPPLTHLAAALASFWPLPAFLLLALPGVLRSWRAPMTLFLLAWVLPTWVIFELTATKLPHYTMPLLPALAILAAGLLAEAEAAPGRAWRWGAAALFTLPLVGVALANVVAPIYLGAWPSPPGAILAALALIPGLAAAHRLHAGAAVSALPGAMAGAFLMIVATWGFTMPALSPIWISPRLAEAADRVAACPNPQVASAGFNEPSYVFLQGTDTLLTTAEAAAAHLLEAPAGACRVAVVESHGEERFLEALKEGGAPQEISSDRVRGLNINGGKTLDIGVYRLNAPATPALPASPAATAPEPGAVPATPLGADGPSASEATSATTPDTSPNSPNVTEPVND